MKRLQLYYWYIGIPVIMVALGAILFMDAIEATIHGNPHPQINYIIFGLIALGCYQTLAHVRRINREGAIFRQYRKMVESGVPDQDIQDLLGDFSKKHDVVPLIQLIQGLRGQPVSAVQHAAAESEMERFAARQSRRLIMAQFMGGLMVGMGLLGTFIGLLGALAEIGKLIGSFNLGAGMTDPLAAISELVARLTAPMQAMGVAFSASLFGVLGSLIMGLLMVGVKGASTDLISFVQSDMAMLIEIKPRSEPGEAAGDHLVHALAELAEHSPTLQGLGVALNHSERRVRELLAGLGTLVSRVETANHASSALVQLLHTQTQQMDTLHLSLEKMHHIQKELSDRQAQLATMIEGIGRHSRDHMDLVRGALEAQNERLNGHMNEMNRSWHAQTMIYQDRLEAWQREWQQQVQHHQMVRENEWSRWIEVQNTGVRNTCAMLSHVQRSVDQLRQETMADVERSQSIHAERHEQTRLLINVVESAASQLNRDTESRAVILQRIDRLLEENHLRHEQLFDFISNQIKPASRSTV